MVVAIVAIPAADEPVWDVSSEKIPHLTILTLGESVEDEIGITQYVQHTVEHTAERFGLSVDRRGLLGDKDADVLFFEKTPWGFGTVKRLRDNLLRDNDILRGYITSPQFEGWTPHLTLGWPDRPASDPENRYDLNYVRFDKIAIWFGDYEGPTFDLPNEFGPTDLRMADEIGDFLAHYGVKGMKWGVRKDHFGLGAVDLATGQRLADSVSRDPKNLLNKSQSKDVYKVMDVALKHLDKKSTVAAYNSAMSAERQKMKTFDVDKFRAAAAKTLSEQISTAFTEAGITGVSVKTFPIGPNQFQFIVGDSKTVDAALKDIGATKIAHADQSGVGKFMVEFLWAENGDPNGYAVSSLDISHSDVENFLAHHGIKGMKWGVRRTDAQLGNDDGGRNGVKSKSGVDVVPSKLSRKEKKEILREAAENKTRDANAPKKFGDNNSDREIDNPADVKISEDAIRFVQTRLKDGHEMSTREIQEAIKRADQIDKYNKLFNSPDQFNRDLHNKLDALQKTKEIAALEAELKGPSATQKVTGFIKSAANGYKAYKDFTEKMGLPDPIGDAVRTAFGGAAGTKAAKKEVDKVVEQVKKEKLSRQEKRDRAFEKKLEKFRKQHEKEAAKVANTHTQLAPPRVPTLPKRTSDRPLPGVTSAPTPSSTVSADSATVRRPGLTGTVVRPRSDRPYEGANPTIFAPPGPYGTAVRHDDMTEFFAKFGIKKEVLDD